MDTNVVVYMVIVLGAVLISMTFHEAMHAYASYWLGDDTARLHGRLTLNPIKHIDPFLTILLPLVLALYGGPIFGAAKPVPFNPHNIRWGEWGTALVALAGPFANLFIAFILFGLASLFENPINFIVNPVGYGEMILAVGITVNLGFFIFNMIPIPPLDGSRVLYALAPEFVKRGMEAMEQFGIVIVFALILIGGPAFNAFFSTATYFFIQIFARIYGT